MKEVLTTVEVTVRFDGAHCADRQENDEGLSCDGLAYTEDVEAYCSAYGGLLDRDKDDRPVRCEQCRKRHGS